MKKRVKKKIFFSPWGWMLFGILALSIGGASFYLESSPKLNEIPDLATIDRGKIVFEKNCVTCHGKGARGQNPNQPNGGQNPDGTFFAPALNGTAHAWHHPNHMLFDVIKNGSPAQESPMRGFAGKLSDQEIVAVIHYFQSMWPMEVRMARASRMN